MSLKVQRGSCRREDLQQSGTFSRQLHDPPCALRVGSNLDRKNSARSKGEMHLTRAATQLGSQSKRPFQAARHKLLKLISSPFFTLMTFAIIVLNSILLGFAAQHEASDAESDDAVIDAMIFVCGGFFVLEFGLWLLAEGPYQHLCKGPAWNRFDAVVALESLLSCLMTLFGGDGWDSESSLLHNVGLIRSTKVLKMFRILRMLRVIQFAVSLRHLLHCIMVALRLLVWAVVLLLIVVYVFAVFFTSIHDSRHDSPQLSKHFGSIYISMNTLVQAICGGLSWGAATEALRRKHVLYEATFLVYIAISYLTVLNVVTGVFTTVALKTSETDPDLISMSQAENTKRQREVTDRFFNYLDADGSGGVALSEIEEVWEDSTMTGFLNSLHLNTEDPWVFFSLIDVNDDGIIDYQELMDAVERLNGNSLAVELSKLQLGQHWMIQCLNMMSYRKGNRCGGSPQPCPWHDKLSRLSVALSGRDSVGSRVSRQASAFTQGSEKVSAVLLAGRPPGSRTGLRQ